MNTPARSTAASTVLPDHRSRISGFLAGSPGSPEKDGEVGAEQSTHDRLWALARNLWWTWHPEVATLFRDLDPIRWRQVGHNPITLLSEFSLERLESRFFRRLRQFAVDINPLS